MKTYMLHIKQSDRASDYFVVTNSKSKEEATKNFLNQDLNLVRASWSEDFLADYITEVEGDVR